MKISGSWEFIQPSCSGLERAPLLNGDHVEVLSVESLDVSTTIGKYIIVGLTYVNHQGEVTHQAQFHGRVERIEGHCLIIKQPSGEEFSMPADVRAIKPAAPGLYRFRSTGECVEDPDFMMTWTVHQPVLEQEK